MRTLALTVLPLAIVAGLATTRAGAHHSWSGEYDVGRSASISGTVTNVMLRNPHSALILNVAGDNGRQERWTVEWASPQRLRERGITATTLRVGARLFVSGNPHRDSKVRSLRALSVRRADDGMELGADRPGGR
jgi:hypothetical protein